MGVEVYDLPRFSTYRAAIELAAGQAQSLGRSRAAEALRSYARTIEGECEEVRSPVGLLSDERGATVEPEPTQAAGGGAPDAGD